MTAARGSIRCLPATGLGRSTRLRSAAQDPLVVDLVRGGAFVRGVAPAAKARLAEWVNPLYFSDAEIARIAGALSRRCSVESSL